MFDGEVPQLTRPSVGLSVTQDTVKELSVILVILICLGDCSGFAPSLYCWLVWMKNTPAPIPRIRTRRPIIVGILSLLCFIFFYKY